MAQILVVEDDLDILQLLRSRLESYGHDVNAFNSPTKALFAVNHGYTPDVVCLDIGLPEMDGMYLWYRLRRHPRLSHLELPTIFISAYDDPEHVVEGRALGATYITKPFAPSTLQRAIAQATAKRPAAATELSEAELQQFAALASVTEDDL